MNRAKLKFTVYLMITLFGFNYFASTLNQILLQYTPEAYKIDTSSVKKFEYLLFRSWLDLHIKSLWLLPHFYFLCNDSYPF